MPEKDIFEEDSDIDIQADIPQSVTIAEYAGEVEVGEVTTLPAGSDATVTNRGTATKAILDFGLPKGDSGADWGEIGGDLSDQSDLSNALNSLQNTIDSKASSTNTVLTGIPVAPTAVDNTNTTQIATTEFVQNAITNLNVILRSYIQSYVNTAVANVLKIMDFSNAISKRLERGDYSYTVPGDGYIIFTRCNGSNYFKIANKVVIRYSSSSEFDGTAFSVKSGVTVSLNSNPAQSSEWAEILFVPFAS